MITLLHGDCLELMPTIEAGSVDAIIADLPYGTTACKWDTVIPFAPLWKEYKRIIKRNGAIVLFGSQPFTSALVMSNPAMFRYEWIWDKPTAGNVFSANRQPLKYHENIAVFYREAPTYNPQKWLGTPNHSRKQGETKGNSAFGNLPRLLPDLSGWKFPRSIIAFGKHPASEALHPTQKPVALLEYLIRTYTNEGDTVLDNTMGVGSTLVAAINTGRNAIGIEKDAGYFAIAQKRIEEAQNKARQAEFAA